MRRILLYLTFFICVASCQKKTDPADDSVDIGSGTWRISYLMKQQDEAANFSAYYFMFLNGGTLMAHTNSNVKTGTWSRNGNRMIINFSEPLLTDLNGDWLVTEITTTSIKLEINSSSPAMKLYFSKN
jgi:hypothetical protein